MPTVTPFNVSAENPYHITGRCLNKEWFAVPLPIVWEIFSDYLHFIARGYNLRIHSFVLMSNHFHMLVSSPTGELSSGMQYFMSQTSRVLAKEANRINHIWGARFYRSEITTYHHYLNCYKYCYRNPVTARAVEKVESYAFSTLQGKLGLAHLTIPVVEDVTLLSSVEETLLWLNRAPSCDNLDAMRKALKRSKFTLGKQNRKPHSLNHDLL